jgi:hypothetical protein
MQSQLVNIFLLSLVSMFNPTLLAAVTVMLLLPSAKRLMFGYLLGAYTASITAGLVIVFALHSSSVTSTAKHTLSPAEDIVVGVVAALIASVLATGRDKPFAERRREKKDVKAEAKAKAGKPAQSLPLRLLGQGDPRVAFVVGAILSFPGVSYLAALNRIHKLNPGTVETVLVVVAFCLIEQMFLELPLLGYVFAPESTADRITRFRVWMGTRGRAAAVIGGAVIGLLLITRGLINLR